MKLIGGGSLYDSATVFYSQLEILKLTDLFKLEIGKFVHAHLHNKLPHYLNNYFTLTRAVSELTTRSSNEISRLYIPRYKTNRLQKCIKYQGVKIWNEIPPNIQNLSKKLLNLNFKNSC